MNRANRLLPYNQIIEKIQKSDIRKECIPITNYISLHIPTMRLDKPAYIAFSCAMSLRPTMRYDSPQAWWAFSARNGTLIAYVPCTLMPFSKTDFEDQSSQFEYNPTIKYDEATIPLINENMTHVAPFFFSRIEDPSLSKDALLQLLSDFIDPALMPVYKELAPDFFEWLSK